MTKAQAKLLIEDLEYKKQFDAHYSTTCDECGNDIEEGMSFVFMGDRKKICIECLGNLQDSLEEL